MLGKGLRLYKSEKLCSTRAIDRLFACRPGMSADNHTDAWGEVRVALCYPLRMIYGTNYGKKGAPIQFLISVPKKRLRKAVDRVTMRRRIRECYRLVRGPVEKIQYDDTLPRLDVVFIYVGSKKEDSARVRKAMSRLLGMLMTQNDSSENGISETGAD